MASADAERVESQSNVSRACSPTQEKQGLGSNGGVWFEDVLAVKVLPGVRTIFILKEAESTSFEEQASWRDFAMKLNDYLRSIDKDDFYEDFHDRDTTFHAFFIDDQKKKLYGALPCETDDTEWDNLKKEFFVMLKKDTHDNDHDLSSYAAMRLKERSKKFADGYPWFLLRVFATRLFGTCCDYELEIEEKFMSWKNAFAKEQTSKLIPIAEKLFEGKVKSVLHDFKDMTFNLLEKIGNHDRLSDIYRAPSYQNWKQHRDELENNGAVSPFDVLDISSSLPSMEAPQDTLTTFPYEGTELTDLQPIDIEFVGRQCQAWSHETTSKKRYQAVRAALQENLHIFTHRSMTKSEYDRLFKKHTRMVPKLEAAFYSKKEEQDSQLTPHLVYGYSITEDGLLMPLMPLNYIQTLKYFAEVIALGRGNMVNALDDSKKIKEINLKNIIYCDERLKSLAWKFLNNEDVVSWKQNYHISDKKELVINRCGIIRISPQKEKHAPLIWKYQSESSNTLRFCVYLDQVNSLDDAPITVVAMSHHREKILKEKELMQDEDFKQEFYARHTIFGNKGMRLKLDSRTDVYLNCNTASNMKNRYIFFIDLVAHKMQKNYVGLLQNEYDTSAYPRNITLVQSRQEFLEWSTNTCERNIQAICRTIKMNSIIVLTHEYRMKQEEKRNENLNSVEEEQAELLCAASQININPEKSHNNEQKKKKKPKLMRSESVVIRTSHNRNISQSQEEKVESHDDKINTRGMDLDESEDEDNHDNGNYKDNDNAKDNENANDGDNDNDDGDDDDDAVEADHDNDNDDDDGADHDPDEKSFVRADILQESLSGKKRKKDRKVVKAQKENGTPRKRMKKITPRNILHPTPTPPPPKH